MKTGPSLLPLLLLAAACSTPARLPEGPLEAVLPLAVGSQVVLRTRMAIPGRLEEEQLGELVTCALEQSPSLDFHWSGGSGPAPARARARLEVTLERFGSSPDRFHLTGRLTRLADGKGALCRAPVAGTATVSLLAAVDSLARALRRSLGEKVPVILASSRPVARLCTGRLPALARITAARRHQRAGEPSLALQELREALRIDPACGRALVLQASILADHNQRAAAMHALERAAFTRPDLTGVDRHRLDRCRLRLLGDWAGLLEAGRAFRESHPASPQGRVSRGIALNRLGRFGAAEQEWNLLSTRRPRSALVRFQLGVARYGRGNFAGAARAWAGLEERGAPAFDARFYLALALAARGEWERAGALLQEKLDRTGGSARMRARLRRTLCALALLRGDRPAARAEALAILGEGRMDPAGCRPEWSLACRFLLHLGEREEVETFLKGIHGAEQGAFAEMRLTLIWLRGLVAAAATPRANLADQSAGHLRRQGRTLEARQIEALLARGRQSPAARRNALEQVAEASPTPWNRFALARALCDQGRPREARGILTPITRQGLALDLGRLAYHPLANPLSAVALVEGRRLLAEIDRVDRKLGGGEGG